MQRGDISNSVAPRMLFRWEGLIADLPTGTTWRMAGRGFGRWRRAVETYHTNGYVLDRLWEITWRHDLRFDVFTFLPAAAVPWIIDRLDLDNVPYANVLRYPGPQELARALAHMPYVATVFDGDPANALAYGSRGRIMTPNSGPAYL